MSRSEIRRVSLPLMVVCVLLLCCASAAQAEITYQSSFGSFGSGAGALSSPAGLAINDAVGDVYVADHNNNRVEEFSSAGAFVRMWGYDVVGTGTDNRANLNEVDEVRIRATSGTFDLRFRGEETEQIGYDASAAAVQSALDALPAIKTGGGAVTVTRIEASPTEFIYTVTFGSGTPGNPIQKVNLELELESSGLGLPAGTQLSCEGIPGGGGLQEGFEYQWLADGEPLAGATDATFIPGASEEGKTIQCRAVASFGSAKAMAVSRPYFIASPAPATLPPLGPSSPAAPTGHPIVESIGGTTLSCSAGSWQRSPETYTYRWYRNGAEIGSPTTTISTSSEYTLTEADVATRAVFQCGVTAKNAGGSSNTISRFLASDPRPIQPEAEDIFATAIVAPSSSSRVLTRTNGGAQLEVCNANPPSNDVCKAGVPGNGFGQLNAPRSIAVDNSPSGAGAVYVMDDGNPRVQKFSAGGVPILESGGEVDQTTEANVCTAASGDACGPGTLARGEQPGAFGEVPVSEIFGGQEFAELGNELGVDGSGNLYVGDPRGIRDPTQPRIEKFDSAGNYLAQSKVPSNGRNGRLKPLSVAADSAQRVFASTYSEHSSIERFSSPEFDLSGDEAVRPGNLFDEDTEPVQLAIDPRNDRLLVSDRNQTKKNAACGAGTSISGRAIAEFDSSQNLIDCNVPAGPGDLPQVTGLAVSPTDLLYVAVAPADAIKVFELPSSAAPQISATSATDITTETATLHGQINPGFEDTVYSVEYGLADCETNACETAAGGVLRGLKFTDGATQIQGLEPNTTYHYRVVAENPLGIVEGPDRTFTTFPLVDLVNDSCPNALARKQTKTVGLLDCRAYELASASFAGGYDVESNLVPGQAPFDASPEAAGKLLYGVHEGGIPGTGVPTNRGLDPYLATRGDDGAWTTRYLGIPADNPYALAPFSSTLAGADRNLETLAFAGQICEPCFQDGSSGIPVRLPTGELVQGMTGSEPDPNAESAGYVAKPLSADGSHLLFGTDAKLEPSANEGGNPTIYERDLGARHTEVVSTDEAGATISGTEVGALDVSATGARVLVGAEVNSDGAGNPLWHFYLHRSGDAHSVDLMHGASQGAYFDGMTEDGTRVFFTTKERLLSEDEDESADVYEAQVDEESNLSVRLVSTRSDGSPSNDDSCEPPTWNTPAGEGKCGALAFAGGAGVASSSGDFYFLSPELLEGSDGTKNQANLYVVKAGGHPRFVTTIDSSGANPAILHAVHPLTHSYGDFQVTPGGNYAIFSTQLPLKPGYDNASKYEVYRYGAEGRELTCVSCDPTGSQAQSDSVLPPNGLGLLEDGRVFFNTGEQLTLSDTNAKLDAYEFSPQRAGTGGCKLPGGCLQLISSGTSPFPSGLLGVSSDGADALFFTRDLLVEEDRNGQAMKVYDARAGGGNFVIPPPPPCAASDECHGPGTQAAAPPQIGSLKGTGGQEDSVTCKKPKVKRREKCVSRHHKSHRHPKRKHHGRSAPSRREGVR